MIFNLINTITTSSCFISIQSDKQQIAPQYGQHFQSSMHRRFITANTAMRTPPGRPASSVPRKMSGRRAGRPRGGIRQQPRQAHLSRLPMSRPPGRPPTGPPTRTSILTPNSNSIQSHHLRHITSPTRQRISPLSHVNRAITDATNNKSTFQSKLTPIATSMNKKNDNNNNNCYVTGQIDFSVLSNKRKSKYNKSCMKKKILKIKLGAKVSDAKNISLIKSNKLKSGIVAVKANANKAIKVHSKKYDIRERLKPKSKTDCQSTSLMARDDDNTKDKVAGRVNDVLRKDIRNKIHAFYMKTLAAMAKCGLDVQFFFFCNSGKYGGSKCEICIAGSLFVGIKCQKHLRELQQRISNEEFIKHKESIKNIVAKTTNNCVDLLQTLIKLSPPPKTNSNHVEQGDSMRDDQSPSALTTGPTTNSTNTKQNDMSTAPNNRNNNDKLKKFDEKSDFEKMQILIKYEEYLVNENQFKSFLQKQATINSDLGIRTTISVVTPIQQEIMALLNIVDTIVIQNYPLSHLTCLNDLVGKLGGIKVTHHTSTTTGTEILMALSDAQTEYNYFQIKNAITWSTSFDVQSKFNDSWLAVLTFVRDQKCLNKMIFTHSQSLLQRDFDISTHNSNVNNNNGNNNQNDGNIDKNKASSVCNKDIIATNKSKNSDNAININNNGVNDSKTDNIVYIPVELETYETSDRLFSIIYHIYTEIGVNWERFNSDSCDGANNAQATGKKMVKQNPRSIHWRGPPHAHSILFKHTLEEFEGFGEMKEIAQLTYTMFYKSHVNQQQFYYLMQSWSEWDESLKKGIPIRFFAQYLPMISWFNALNPIILLCRHIKNNIKNKKISAKQASTLEPKVDKIYNYCIDINNLTIAATFVDFMDIGNTNQKLLSGKHICGSESASILFEEKEYIDIW